MLFDFNFLPSSNAQYISGDSLLPHDLNFTFTTSFDEKKLFNDITKRVDNLEKSIEIDKKELGIIMNMIDNFQVSINDKEELLIRVDWLSRLYNVKEELPSIKTIEEAEKLKKVISYVQSCRLKNHLLNTLESLEYSLPEKTVQTNEKVLMEKSIDSIGAAFTNLGKAGREYVVANVIARYGDKADVEQIKNSTKSIISRIDGLKEITMVNKMITHLEQLPLKTFLKLDTIKKEAIANRLIKEKRWNSLITLERWISILDKTIMEEEQDKLDIENMINTYNGIVAFTLNIENKALEFVELVK